MPRLSKIGAAALAAFGWTGLSSVTASYLVVAGGGGGGGMDGGGGGAGGYQAGTTSLNPTESYTVIVGAGGAGTASAYIEGNQGSNSSFSTITANGGGKGGAPSATTDTSGGSSGGAGGFGTRTGTASQGNLGGTTGWSGAGGGGAGAVGADTPNSNVSGGAGGAGTANSITGTSVTYAGGGGGGGYRQPGGVGGSGGGGAGGAFAGGVGVSGTANLGGGGGGGGDNSPGAGGAGGSGVVIISYPSPQQFGGGVVTTSGSNTIHTFTTSGTLSPLSTLSASYLIVAGGAGGGTSGGAGGGGGAGGLLSGSSLTIDTNSIYVVTVGAGGVASNNGSNSSFSSVSTVAVGGGTGGASDTNGTAGGSGGGASGQTGNLRTGGAGTSGQGNAGGNNTNAPNYGGGGGGGAGAVGGTGTTTASGAGGAGTASSISGTSVTYAGGGGGAQTPSGASAGAGGSGGGGAGGTGVGSAGTANTGGGGGGGNATTGGAGGSGIVIISYAGSTQLMAGGTVTISGGNVIHTFNSSGYLTPLTLVGNSLRFRSSASAYLNRTFNTPTDAKAQTFSCWIKRGLLGNGAAEYYLLTSGTGATECRLVFNTNDTFTIFLNNTTYRTTTQVFRDPAAWYHIVIALDTSNAIANNRLLMYVNGVVVTAFSTNATVTQNATFNMFSGVAHDLCRRIATSADYLDGYLTEVRLIDGQALTPNSFGTFNQYGVWQPIRYGGSYGTNGFYLPFTNTTNTTTLGLDFSPQGNNWTANNFSLARSTYTSYTSSSGTYTVPAGVTSLSYLVVAGGGGGASWGGGGGAGGLLQGTMAVTGGQTIAYSVGAGGAGALSTGSNGTSGSNSTFGALTAIGGGGGTAGTTVQSGGSGGGSAFGTSGGPGTLIGLGTAGQGNNGGLSSSTTPYQSGGGGAGAVGGNAVSGSGTSGNGGSGLTWVNGTTYAGGGGGGGGVNAGGNWNGGSGGSGGGGAGGTGGVGTSGTANTGGGGGASGRSTNTFFDAGNGGSGIIIIGTGSASTYDSMTDVPTLTSTTAANYAVWNPLVLFPNTTYQATMSNANMLMTRSGGGQGGAVTTMATTTGKFYAEMPVTAVGGSVTKLGVVSSNNPPSMNSGSEYDLGGTSVPASVAYRSNGARLTNGTTTNSWGATYTTGDVIGVAFDADTGKVWFGKQTGGTGSMVWQASGDPAAGTNPAVTLTTTTPATPFYFSAGGESGISIALNCGQQPWSATPPSGFLPLNTFNL